MLALSACGSEEAPPASATPVGPGTNAETAVEQITAELMRDYVIELSDDKYEGRGPGSRGDVAARRYLADRMAVEDHGTGIRSLQGQQQPRERGLAGP